MATLTVQEGGSGDYTTLAAAIAAANASDTITISGTWSAVETLSVTVSDASLRIEAVGDSKYDPTNSSHFQCKSTTGNVFTCSASGIAFDGLNINQAGSTSSAEGIRFSGDGNSGSVNDCFIWASSDVSDQDGIYFNNDSVTITVTNTAIFGFARAGIHLQNFTGEADMNLDLLSSTIYGCGADASTDAGGVASRVGSVNSTHVIKFGNCILVDNETDDISTWDGSANASHTIDRCIYGSVDSGTGTPTDCLTGRTATDSDSPGAGNWVVFENISGGRSTWDLRLKDNAENDAQDMHSDGTVAGETLPTPDFLGTTRPQNTNYDCGWHEIASGGDAETDPVDIGFSLSADAGSVAQTTFTVSPADLALSLTADAGTVAQSTFAVSPAELAFGLTADAGTVAQSGFDVSPADLGLGLTTDASTVAQNTFEVSPVDLSHSLTADAGAAAQNTFAVAPADLSVSITADAGTVAEEGEDIVSPEGLTLGISVDAGSVAQNTFTVSPADLGLSLTAAPASVAQTEFDVTPASLSHGLTMDAGTVEQGDFVASPASLLFSLSSDASAVSQTGFSVAPADIAFDLSAGVGTVEQYTFSVLPDDIGFGMILDTGSLTLPGQETGAKQHPMMMVSIGRMMN
jgi:hypothetical protein